MLNKDLKKRMDRELRQYWINKKKLERLERDIIDESTSGNGQPRANTISNPTEKKAIRLASTRLILYCEERITYVENVIKQLNSFEKQVFYFIFKDGCNCSYCKNMKNIDKSTYYNIYNKSIRLLAEEWGEI